MKHISSWFTDDEAPVMMNCPNNLSTFTDFNQSFAVVSWTNIEATDNSGQTPTVTCSTKSRRRFGIGATEVICQAIDQYENQATCSFTVHVKGNNNIFI